MRVYVLGAGTSKRLGYPLGSELFDEIDNYVRQFGSTFNRFRYNDDWPALCNWLESNRNPLIAKAYRNSQLEYIFTELDLAAMLRTDDLASVWRAAKSGQGASAEAAWREFDDATRDYRRHRQVLLWALEQYFQYRHYSDRNAAEGHEWEALVKFGNRLQPGDFVLTFNYDATVERVLLRQGKWSPRNGYGFEMVFSRLGLPGGAGANWDLPPSDVMVLHLHGATGWYSKPIFRDGYVPAGAGPVAREELSPAPLETSIALDPIFLRDLGLLAVDASLPRPPPDEAQILIHPTYLKNYEMEGHAGGTDVFTDLWRQAAKALREAESVSIIGYSLPAADSAALTLFLTNCDRKRVQIVNQDVSANYRLRSLLAWDRLGSPQSFEQWLESTAD